MAQVSRSIGGLFSLPIAVVLGTGLATTSVGGQETVPVHRPFERGDVDADGGTTLGDVIALLGYLFTPGSGPLPCLDAADINDDEHHDLTDPIDLLGYLFVSGDPPPAPFGSCGPDPTVAVALSCDSYPPCDGIVDIDQAAHIMRRAGYGPTSEGIAFIQAVGADVYIDQQLYPELIDESGNQILQDLLALLVPDSSPVDLIWLQVIRGLYSERQLHEAATEFWENHFTTDLRKVLDLINMIQVGGVPVYTPQEALAEATLWEYQEHVLLRENALGQFVDLLTVSATGKPMLVYLDGIFNIVGAPNENYARELLELHTMGVDNGYLQVDIEEVARCFTGWTICKTDPMQTDDPHGPCFPFDDPNAEWAFHFHPPNHDYGAKTIFEGTVYELDIPARPVGSTLGILDGFQVIGHLATLPQTAEHISTKLVQRFVDDVAPPALIADCLTTWLTTDGDMREVLATILHSEEFLDPQYRWTKVATPIEFLIAQPRATGALTTGLPIIFGVGNNEFTGLVGLDYLPFLYETPEGRSELGFDWMASTHLLHRILYGTLLAEAMTDPLFDPLGIMNDAGVAPGDVDAIVDFWLERLYQHFYTLAERQLVVDFLATDVDGTPTPLDPFAPDYEERVRACIGFILSAPQAQKQ